MKVWEKQNLNTLRNTNISIRSLRTSLDSNSCCQAAVGFVKVCMKRCSSVQNNAIHHKICFARWETVNDGIRNPYWTCRSNKMRYWNSLISKTARENNLREVERIDCFCVISYYVRPVDSAFTNICKWCVYEGVDTYFP